MANVTRRGPKQVIRAEPAGEWNSRWVCNCEKAGSDDRCVAYAKSGWRCPKAITVCTNFYLDKGCPLGRQPRCEYIHIKPELQLAICSVCFIPGVAAPSDDAKTANELGLALLYPHPDGGDGTQQIKTSRGGKITYTGPNRLCVWCAHDKVNAWLSEGAGIERHLFIDYATNMSCERPTLADWEKHHIPDPQQA